MPLAAAEPLARLAMSTTAFNSGSVAAEAEARSRRVRRAHRARQRRLDARHHQHVGRSAASSSPPHTSRCASRQRSTLRNLSFTRFNALRPVPHA